MVNPTTGSERSTTEERQVYTVKEVAQILGLNEKSVYEAIRKHQIPAKRIGKSIRIIRTVFDAWMHSNMAPSQIKRGAKW